MTAELVERRPVRVTIEGTARAVKHDAAYLIVETGSQSLLLLVNGSGVTVEDREPERIWTDGDVVQSATGLVYTRMNEGQWRGQAPSGSLLGFWTDKATSRDVGTGFLKVLRYQAGEQ